ncbi:hypothetical protein M413DRAFT_445739, partial [Hebeloma cylindrosporum]
MIKAQRGVQQQKVTKVTEQWLDTYGQHLDIMGVSCDSFDPDTNLKIGRSQNGRGVHTKVFQVAHWRKDRGIMFKLNSVVGNTTGRKI